MCIACSARLSITASFQSGGPAQEFCDVSVAQKIQNLQAYSLEACLGVLCWVLHLTKNKQSRLSAHRSGSGCAGPFSFLSRGACFGLRGKRLRFGLRSRFQHMGGRNYRRLLCSKIRSKLLNPKPTSPFVVCRVTVSGIRGGVHSDLNLFAKLAGLNISRGFPD